MLSIVCLQMSLWFDMLLSNANLNVQNTVWVTESAHNHTEAEENR